MADIIQSDNPQFNPDEWEECKESSFLWWWRMLATLATVVLGVMVYYYIENSKKQSSNKRDHKKNDDYYENTTGEKKKIYGQYEQQASNGVSNDFQDGGLRQRHQKDEGWEKKYDNTTLASETADERTLVTNSEWVNTQLNKPDAEFSTSDCWAVNKVLTTVEVKLTRQNQTTGGNTGGERFIEEKFEKTVTSNNNAIRTNGYDSTDATSSNVDSSNSDRGDTWSIVDHNTIKELVKHDKSSGLEDHHHDDTSAGRRSPEKPSFVTELKVVDKNAANGDADESTNSILEIANVHTTEELLLKVETLEAITEIMRQAGLESSNLIFGIDYTASNKYQGEESFGAKSLHTVDKAILNPYQQVISIVGKTMAPFASSGFIAAYGFGDVKTSDTDVFSIKSDGFCHSFAEVLKVYNDITPQVILSGPTNFAPLIYQAMDICKSVKDYHILVIVADGQVTNEKATRKAIVDACKYPLSIIVVGVGDGPWEMMKVFDESLPKRKWDNFHFVEFHKVTSRAENPDLAFAIQALLEIPDQYKKIKSLGLLAFSEE